jgi:hypothetical protein
MDIAPLALFLPFDPLAGFSPRTFRWQFGKILAHRYDTLLKRYSGVFGSLK